jgi:hypothetical protein
VENSFYLNDGSIKIKILSIATGGFDESVGLNFIQVLVTGLFRYRVGCKYPHLYGKINSSTVILIPIMVMIES